MFFRRVQRTNHHTNDIFNATLIHYSLLSQLSNHRVLRADARISSPSPLVGRSVQIRLSTEAACVRARMGGRKPLRPNLGEPASEQARSLAAWLDMGRRNLSGAASLSNRGASDGKSTRRRRPADSGSCLRQKAAMPNGASTANTGAARPDRSTLWYTLSLVHFCSLDQQKCGP